MDTLDLSIIFKTIVLTKVDVYDHLILPQTLFELSEAEVLVPDIEDVSTQLSVDRILKLSQVIH